MTSLTGHFRNYCAELTAERKEKIRHRDHSYYSKNRIRKDPEKQEPRKERKEESETIRKEELENQEESVTEDLIDKNQAMMS